MKHHLKDIRECLGVTQKVLADGIGCTQGNVGHYERGQTLPPEMASRVIRFAAEHGLRINYDHVYGELPLPQLIGKAGTREAMVQLSCDRSKANGLLDSLPAELAQRPLQVRKAFVDRLHALGEAAWTVRIDLNVGATACAAQHRVVFEPAEPLLRLLAAFRAGDFDLGVVQETSHGRVPFQ